MPGFMVEKFLVQHAHPTTVFGVAVAGRVDLNLGPTNFFPDAQDTYLWFPGVVSRAYNSSGLSVTIHGNCPASGNVLLEVAYERHQDGVTDLSLTTNFGPGTTAVLSAPSGGFARSVTFSVTAADADNIAAGETYRLRIGRLGTNGSDTDTGLFEFLGYQATNLS